MKKNKYTSRVNIGCIFQCGTVLGLLYWLVPLASLTAQSHHDLKYDPLGLIDHKLSFAYEYIPGNGKWGVELSWERYALNDPEQIISFPAAQTWEPHQRVEVKDFQRSYQGYYLQIRRFFSAQNQGIGQYLGISAYYEGATTMQAKTMDAAVEKVFDLYRSYSYAGLSMGLNFGYKFLLWRHFIIEPNAGMRYLILPQNQSQLGGGKYILFLKTGYRF
jgi:hypothetical protein